jgi:hypothetical protein
MIRGPREYGGAVRSFLPRDTPCYWPTGNRDDANLRQVVLAYLTASPAVPASILPMMGASTEDQGSADVKRSSHGTCGERGATQ